METPIAIPRNIFQQADQLARKLGISRSELYSKALRRFLEEYGDDEIIRQLNEVDKREDTSLDPVSMQIQITPLDHEALRHRVFRPDIVSRLSQDKLGLEVRQGSEIDDIRLLPFSIRVPSDGTPTVPIFCSILKPLKNQSQKPITAVLLEPTMEGDSAGLRSGSTER
jgi:antitoxin MazE6